MRTVTTLGLLVLVFAVELQTGCTIGQQDNSDENQDLAVNRPFKNGCELYETVDECATRKQTSSALACAYIEREENTYFRIGKIDEGDHLWQVENEILLVQPEQYGWTLGEACKRNKKRVLDSYMVTLVPTQAGCEELIREFGGYWDGAHCRASDPSQIPQTNAQVITGTLEPGVPFYLAPISVRPGTQVVVGMEGTGNPDLYVRFGARPTATEWDCRDNRGDALGYCKLTVPNWATEMHIGLYAPGPATFGIGIEQ